MSGSFSSAARALSRGVDLTLDRTIAPGFTALGYAVRRHLPTWPADPRRDALVGHHVAVTGASSGLGRRTALDLAALGATVHLVVRSVERGEVVAREIAAATGREDSARVWLCDVGDLDSVRAFTTSFLAGDVPLRGLVHNAGILPETRLESAQGHELTMAVHVLGPVRMTDLLVPALAADEGRVVFVTSGGMLTQPLPVDDPDFARGTYGGAVAYARSKRGQVELLPVLTRRWAEAGVSVHATHPGWASTPGLDTSLPSFAKLLGPVLRDEAAGVDTTTWLIGRDEAPISGQLWHDRAARPTSLTPRTRPTEAERLRFWQWVVQATDLDGLA